MNQRIPTMKAARPAAFKEFGGGDDGPRSVSAHYDRDAQPEHLITKANQMLTANFTASRWHLLKRLVAARSPEAVRRLEEVTGLT